MPSLRDFIQLTVNNLQLTVLDDIPSEYLIFERFCSFKIAYNLMYIYNLIIYWSSPRPISISQLNMLPYLHL